MKKYIGFLLVMFLLLAGSAKAQILDGKIYKNKWIVGPSASYQYQSNSFLKASLWGLTEVGYADYLKVDAGANFTWQHGKSYVIPELGVTYYLNTVLIWPFVKAEITPYTITPKVGLGIFNVFEVGIGYGWSLQEKRNLGHIEGFNFSVGVSVPLNFTL